MHGAPLKLKKAVYEARRAENMLKHVKSISMKQFNDKPVSAQERDAYASEAYKEAIFEDARAGAELAVIKAEIDAAKMTIDLYRTESATERASYS